MAIYNYSDYICVCILRYCYILSCVLPLLCTVMCPHTTNMQQQQEEMKMHVHEALKLLLHVSVYYIILCTCPHTTTYDYIRVLTSVLILLPRRKRQWKCRINRQWSYYYICVLLLLLYSYYYICVLLLLLLLYMCPVLLYTIRVSSYYYILLYMCPHTVMQQQETMKKEDRAAMKLTLTEMGFAVSPRSLWQLRLASGSLD